MGYQPSDLLKKYLSDFSIIQDQQIIKDQLKQIYETKQTQPVQMTIHLLAQNSASQASAADSSQTSQNVISFKTNAYAFFNPCNEQFEFIVCTHTCQSRPQSSDLSQNSSLYPQAGLTSNGSLHDLNQYQYHNMQQQYQQQHLPTQSSNQSYSLNAHMGSHIGQTSSSMYQSSPNLGNYLMMPSK